MENNGLYIVSLKNEKYEIVYIEKGFTRSLSKFNSKYLFDSYDVAIDYINKNKDELNNAVSSIKEEELKKIRQVYAQEERDELLKEGKTQKENKTKEKKKYDSRSVRAGILATIAVIGTVFALAKGIPYVSEKLDNKKNSIEMDDEENNIFSEVFGKFFSEKVELPENETDRKLTTADVVSLRNNFIIEISNLADYYYEEKMYNELVVIDEFLKLTDEEQIKIITEYLTSVHKYEIIEADYEFNYDSLTTSKFYALVGEVYKKYSELGLDVTEEEVVDFVMMINIDKLATDNKELITTIIGDRDIDVVVSNSMKVNSAIMSYNNQQYCELNKGFDSIITVSELVYDKAEKEVVVNIEKRVKEIVEASGDKTKFNELLNNLLNDMLDPTKEEFNMESGVGYRVMTVLINFIRINFETNLNQENAEQIKYFVNFATDDVIYHENSRTTGFYRGVYSLMTDCVKTESYTRTR